MKRRRAWAAAPPYSRPAPAGWTRAPRPGPRGQLECRCHLRAARARRGAARAAGNTQTPRQWRPAPRRRVTAAGQRRRVSRGEQHGELRMRPTARCTTPRSRILGYLQVHVVGGSLPVQVLHEGGHVGRWVLALQQRRGCAGELHPGHREQVRVAVARGGVERQRPSLQQRQERLAKVGGMTANAGSMGTQACAAVAMQRAGLLLGVCCRLPGSGRSLACPRPRRGPGRWRSTGRRCLASAAGS